MRRLLIALLVAPLLLPAAASGAGPKRVRTSAHFVAYQKDIAPGGCGWGIGITVAPVAGAKQYEVRYFDGYWQRLEIRTVTVKELKADPNRPSGLYFGVTGGTYGAPCDGSYQDPAGGGRFAKGGKAWAIFPAGHKPKPSISVEVIPPNAGAQVGRSVPVKVNVRAGELALTNVSVRGLDGGGSIASVTRRPSGLSGFKLGAGQAKSFSYTVKALAPGAAALSAKASGRSKKGSASGQGRGTLRVAAADLALTMSTDPEKVTLEVDDEGTVEPTEVTVTARVTNTSTADIENVTLQSLSPEPVKKGQKLDQIALPGGSLPVALGTIAAQQSVAKEFKLQVTGDGRYRIRGLATFAAADGGTGKTTGLGGAFEVKVPPFYLKLGRLDDNIDLRGGDPWVRGGVSWYVNGKVKNLSDYRRLCVYPLYPQQKGNAAAIGLVDIAEKNLRDTGGLFGGALEPGRDTTLLMPVDTSPGGPTRSTVEFEPEVGLLDPEQKCTDDTWPKLDKLVPPEDFIVPDPGLTFEVHVDVSQPVKEADPVAFGGALLLGVGRNLAVDTMQGILGMFALAREGFNISLEYSRLYPSVPPFASYFAIRSIQAIHVATDVYATYWKYARRSLKQNVFQAAGTVLKRTSNEFFTGAVDTVRKAAAPYMAKVEKAYGDNDSAAVGYLWGQAIGSAAQQVVVGIFLKSLSASVVEDAAAIESRVAAAGAEWKQAQAAKALETAGEAATRIAKETVPAGTELRIAEKAGVWGIDELSDRLFKKIAAKWNVVIGVRSRAAESIKKLANGSVWKHENLKPKNVNRFDIDFLGFRPDDLAEVRFRTYTNEQVAAITNFVRDHPTLTQRQKLAILDRFETRIHEGERYLAKIQGFSKKGEINVGFNYRDNGLDKATTRQIRKFRLEGEAADSTGHVPAGGEYYTPLQENLDLYHLRKPGSGALPANCRRALSAVLCTVTGDVDGVYVTLPNGSAVPQDDLVKIYEELAAAGWQHPETLTWVDNAGNFYFGSKADILKGLEVGGEALVEYAPDGIERATYLALKESDLVGNDNYWIRRVGGYNDVVKRPGT